MSDVGTVVIRSLNETEVMATGREFSLLYDVEGELIGTASQLIPGMTDDDLARLDAALEDTGATRLVVLGDSLADGLWASFPIADFVSTAITAVWIVTAVRQLPNDNQVPDTAIAELHTDV